MGSRSEGSGSIYPRGKEGKNLASWSFCRTVAFLSNPGPSIGPPVGQGHAQAGALEAMQMRGLVVERCLIHIAKCRSIRGAPTGS